MRMLEAGARAMAEHFSLHSNPVSAARDNLKVALLAMSEAEPDESVVEAAAKAVDPPAWQAGRDEKPWGSYIDRQAAARGIARAAIKAALKEMAG